jgi:hypothetical protein
VQSPATIQIDSEQAAIPMSDLPAEQASQLPVRGKGTRARHVLLLALFTSAVFLSAALLFAVQPLFTKLVLPRFGGAPSVWSVAIVFFQATLLAAYGYAHMLMRYAGAAKAVLVHVAVTAAACIWLPLSLGAWRAPPPGWEMVWLIALFTASIGAPFFALAANSPLLQSWFAHSDHPGGGDPYFLYVISNAASLAALLAYPAVIEPYMHLSDQARYWSFLFYALTAAIASCGLLLLLARSPVATAHADEASSAPNWRDALRWAALAAVPAGLLVAVTAHISTDIAAVPLLWIVPLATYLLTFVIVFARRPLINHAIAAALQPLCIIGLTAIMVFEPIKTIHWMIAVHVGALFVCALLCHGEIARCRPSPRFLTAYFLWISAGGVAGSVAAALLAPHVFNWVAEYPLFIAFAALCVPARRPPTAWHRRSLLLSALTLAASFLIICSFFSSVMNEAAFNWTVGVLLVACVLLQRVPPAFAAVIASILFANHIFFEQAGTVSARSFFGVAKIVESPDHHFRILQHGTTMHGAERIRAPDGTTPSGLPEPLLYYWDGSGIAQTFDAIQSRSDRAVRYAVVGLGTGSLACRARKQDQVDFYEIDPAIVRIASDPQLFTFLSACRPDAPIVLGDARLTLARAPAAAYDLLVVDAFSSDAIPTHLLTREAVALYLEKLAPNGMIVMHVSNRHLELASVVAGVAAANGLLMLLNDGADVDESLQPYRFGGTVAALARRDADFGALAQSRDWEPATVDPNQRMWTDDYSNILGSALRKLRE